LRWVAIVSGVFVRSVAVTSADRRRKTEIDPSRDATPERSFRALVGTFRIAPMLGLAI
jgi:hypothetical protein